MMQIYAVCITEEKSVLWFQKVFSLMAHVKLLADADLRMNPSTAQGCVIKHWLFFLYAAHETKQLYKLMLK